MKKILAYVLVLGIIMSFMGCKNNGNKDDAKNAYDNMKSLCEIVESYSEFVLLSWNDGFTGTDSGDSIFFLYKNSANYPDKDAVNMELIAKYTGKKVDEVRSYLISEYGATNYTAQNKICNDLFDFSLYYSDIPHNVYLNMGILETFYNGLNIYSEMCEKLAQVEQNIRNLKSTNDEMANNLMEVLRNVTKLKEVCDEIVEFCRDANRASETKKSNYSKKSSEISEYVSSIEDAMYFMSFQVQ